MIGLYNEFKTEVIEEFQKCPLLPLYPDCGLKEAGVYGIFYKGELVYIGKVSSFFNKRYFLQRFNEHLKKVEDRTIDLSDLFYKYLSITENWQIYGAEIILIKHYDPPWNNTGFGNKMFWEGCKWEKQYPRIDKKVSMLIFKQKEVMSSKSE